MKIEKVGYALLMCAAFAAAMAVGCAQGGKGAPPLQAREAWKPRNDRLLSRFAPDVSPQNPLPDYPRPQMARAAWQSLNGLWDSALSDKSETEPPTTFGKQILVPFPYEAALSGVGQGQSIPDQNLWYWRTLSVKHDEDAEVYLDGVLAARVPGYNNGYDLVALNEAARAALKPGENTFAVHVHRTTGGQGIDIGIVAPVAAPLVNTTAQNAMFPHTKSPFVMGADLSLLGVIQEHGVSYKDGGQVKDPLLIFKDHGLSSVRLRLFVAPDGTAGQVNTLPYTLKLAKRVKAAGLHFYLDLHYSDVWADPEHQTIPAKWQNLSHAQLVARVHDYTRGVLEDFKREGCAPDMVSIGNEVGNGMMWPDGGPLNSEARWDAFAELLGAGIRAVREAQPKALVMIHTHEGGNKDICEWFYSNLQKRDVKFDVIGLSYYPFWHGPLANLESNLAALSHYGKDIYVVETGYDTWGGDRGTLPYPITPAGQKTFLEQLIRTVAATPGGHGKGVFYWAPEWIRGAQWGGPPWGGQWENRALFDHDGNALPAMQAFQLSPTL